MAPVADYPATRGEGHREADPPALADLVPDGRAAAGLGARDQARGRGLQRHERRRLRAPLLRRPRRARVASASSSTVEKPAEGVFEQENYSLPPGELLPAGDRVHRRRAGGAADRADAARRRVRLRRAAAPRAAADLLGPPEPAAARPSSARSRWRSPPRPAAATSPSAWPRSRRRSSAARRSSSPTTRWSATRPAKRKVDPYHLLFRGGQFYLIGHSHERDAVRVFRLSRIRGKVAYATKAEHDFSPPEDFDPRDYASRADWQLRRDRRRRRRSSSATGSPG